MWIGVGCPCSPVRNDIVTPRHLLIAVSSFFLICLLTFSSILQLSVFPSILYTFCLYFSSVPHSFSSILHLSVFPLFSAAIQSFIPDLTSRLSSILVHLSFLSVLLICPSHLSNPFCPGGNLRNGTSRVLLLTWLLLAAFANCSSSSFLSLPLHFFFPPLHFFHLLFISVFLFFISLTSVSFPSS